MKKNNLPSTPAAYYDRVGVLPAIVEGPVKFALKEELRAQILAGKRKRHPMGVAQ